MNIHCIVITGFEGRKKAVFLVGRLRSQNNSLFFYGKSDILCGYHRKKNLLKCTCT